MKNKTDLDRIREEEKNLGEDWIRVGMSTCGIAAGAGEIYDYLKMKIEKNSLNIRLRKCGCLGACYAEPLVEVNIQGMPHIVYGNVTQKIAERIIKEHVMTGRILDSGIFELKTSEI